MPASMSIGHATLAARRFEHLAMRARRPRVAVWVCLHHSHQCRNIVGSDEGFDQSQPSSSCAM